MKKVILVLISFLGASLSYGFEVDPELCPSTAQKILVIDLKSGWWAGDGGDFGKNLMTPWQEVCEGKITFEYQHRTFGNGIYNGGENGSPGFGSFGDGMFGSPPSVQPKDDARFPKDDWSTYSQIWLLSGGEADSVDLRIETALWKRYQEGMASSGANIFIGGSFGNVYHANALTKALGLNNIFVTDREAHEYPKPASGVEGKSSLASGNELTSHELFDGVQSIVDDLKVGQYLMVSDSLDETSGKFNTLAKNTKGKPSIGVSEEGGQKIVFDAGVHRFYGILNSQPDTLKYLQNISLFLTK